MSVNVKEMRAEVYLKLPCSKNKINYTNVFKNIEDEENWYKGYVQMYSTCERNFGRTKQYRIENGIFKYETAVITDNGFDHSKHEFLPATIILTKITQGDIFNVINHSKNKIFICLPTNLNDDVELTILEDNDYITFNTPKEPKIAIKDVNILHKA